MTGRAVFNTAEGIVVRPLPSADGAGMRVRVSSVGICSSDLWLLAQGPSPFAVGHEIAGRLDDGAPVAVYPLARCGTCDQCAPGAFNRCRQVFVGTLGLGAHGGMREELHVPAEALVPLPADLDPADAALVEPFAVAVHARNRAAAPAGARVAVVGAGALGLSVAAVFRAAGHPTTIVARHRHQHAAAEALDLDLAAAGEYDVVVDAAGTETGLARAVDLLRPGGTLLLLSLFPAAGVIFPALPLMVKEATVVTALAYRHGHGQDDFDVAADYLRTHPQTAAALVTHRFGLDDAAAAFAAAGNRAGGAIKVLVHPN